MKLTTIDRKKFRVRLLIRSKKSLNIQKKLATLISNFKFLIQKKFFPRYMKKGLVLKK